MFRTLLTIESGRGKKKKAPPLGTSDWFASSSSDESKSLDFLLVNRWTPKNYTLPSTGMEVDKNQRTTCAASETYPLFTTIPKFDSFLFYVKVKVKSNIFVFCVIIHSNVLRAQ